MAPNILKGLFYLWNRLLFHSYSHRNGYDITAIGITGVLQNVCFKTLITVIKYFLFIIFKVKETLPLKLKVNMGKDWVEVSRYVQ